MAGEPTAMPDEAQGEPIPLSALQHAVYCLRQAALIHLERMWAENRFTAEGRVLHVGADRPGQRKVRGVRRVAALPLASQRLGIAGIADLVEFHGDGARSRFRSNTSAASPSGTAPTRCSSARRRCASRR